ncbi:MAG: hypothetical protein KDN18_24215 [Verrucomicrobiae bacterium]|nr:hypothetical protein [Verrucomicrobiae bacterium]
MMPLLIASLLGAMTAFYFRTNESQSPAADPDPIDTVADAAPVTAPEVDHPEGQVPPSTPAAKTLPLVKQDDLEEADFTPWMSTLALETYIRQKNRGYRDSFWSRGNWIRGVECRWHEGAREVRIALGTMSRPGQIGWQYRLDMTSITFAEELERWSQKGYTLIQSQAYRHPDGSRRYQAVWQLAKEAEVAGR